MQSIPHRFLAIPCSMRWFFGCLGSLPFLSFGCSGAAVESKAPAALPPAHAVPAIEPAQAARENARQPADDEPVKPRPIIGKKTADIRDAEQEEAKGAHQVQPRVTGQDPITISASAYTSIIGRTEVLRIKHTLDLYHAEHGRYPKDLKEFMAEIIKKNGIRLAQLPYYQEYGYDAPNHQLVILEYPDRKAAAGQ